MRCPKCGSRLRGRATSLYLHCRRQGCGYWRVNDLPEAEAKKLYLISTGKRDKTNGRR